MTRTEIINSLIEKNSYASYLEIGVQRGVNYSAVNCTKKLGVDPDRKSAADIFQTSDLFFSLNQDKFDLVFIDGLHHADQVERDILNATKVLTPYGMIICHDMNPEKEAYQVIPRGKQKVWTGDCWKAWVKLRSVTYGWDFTVVDTDFGVGIIHRDTYSKPTIKPDALTYPNLDANRKKWLNLISVNDFKQLYLDKYRAA